MKDAKKRQKEKDKKHSRKTRERERASQKKKKNRRFKLSLTHTQRDLPLWQTLSLFSSLLVTNRSYVRDRSQIQSSQETHTCLYHICKFSFVSGIKIFAKYFFFFFNYLFGWFSGFSLPHKTANDRQQLWTVNNCEFLRYIYMCIYMYVCKCVCT